MIHRGMRLAALLLTSLLACAHKSAGEPIELRRETVAEDKAEVVVELLYTPKGARQVEITLKMRVNGLVESNKLVVDMFVQGFNIEDGGSRWDGFILPRQPQTYRVLLSIPDDREEATAKLSLVRSNDSFPLLREELSFRVGPDGVVAPQ